jgi:hypothetical protein
VAEARPEEHVAVRGLDHGEIGVGEGARGKGGGVGAGIEGLVLGIGPGDADGGAVAGAELVGREDLGQLELDVGGDELEPAPGRQHARVVLVGALGGEAGGADRELALGFAGGQGGEQGGEQREAGEAEQGWSGRRRGHGAPRRLCC